MSSSLAGPPDESGQRAARRILREFPHRIESSGVELEGLAQELEVKVVPQRELPTLGRWHRFRRPPGPELRLWSEEAPEADVVHLKTDIDNTPRRRFVLAHEIGHAVLHRQLDGRSMELPISEQEQFANAFAAELLLPSSMAGRLREPFQQLTDVLELLRLAGSVRVPARVLLIRAKRENWLEGVDVLWVDIRTVPNRFTGRERRLRVFDSVCDKSRWFLPSNKSVKGTFGDDTWLVGMGPKARAGGRIKISRRSGSPPKFVNTSVPAETVAFRLRSPKSDFGPEVLARVCLGPERD
jgi:hypothetical protein